MMPITPVVKQLLILNIIFFAGSLIVPQANEYLSMYFFESPKFGIWQIFTHMFMHGNILHIAFNMFALYSFGSALEHFWGGKKFLFFYISCGLGSALLHTAVNYFEYQQAVQVLLDAQIPQQVIDKLAMTGQYNDALLQKVPLSALENVYYAVNTPMLGASGAIYGLLVAFAFMFPNMSLFLMFLPIPIKAKYFVPVLLVYDLIAGLKGNSIFGGSDGIAHFAHLGGAILGFVMMWYWKKNSFNRNRWD